MLKWRVLFLWAVRGITFLQKAHLQEHINASNEGREGLCTDRKPTCCSEGAEQGLFRRTAPGRTWLKPGREKHLSFLKHLSFFLLLFAILRLSPSVLAKNCDTAQAWCDRLPALPRTSYCT